MWLKIYDKEFKEFPAEQKKYVPKNQVSVILGGLANHFKMEKPTIEYLAIWIGRVSVTTNHIKVSKYELPSLGLIIHEFAHLLAWKLYWCPGHRGEFYECLRAVYQVAKVKKYSKGCVSSKKMAKLK